MLRGYWSGPVPATAQQTITDPSVFTLCDLVCEAVRDRLDALQAILPPAPPRPPATKTGKYPWTIVYGLLRDGDLAQYFDECQTLTHVE